MNKKQVILQVLSNAKIIFQIDQYYDLFIESIYNNNFQKARYYLDMEMSSIILQDHFEHDVRFKLYDETEDLLMDLIINEMDGEARKIKESIK